MATPMLSSDFRIIVDPILSKAFDGVYELREDQYKTCFKDTPASYERNYEDQPVLFGMNAAPEMPEGTPVTYQSGGVLFTKKYNFGVYGLAFALSKVLVSDGDHIAIGKTYARHLAQSMMESKELLCAAVLNRAFNNAYPGGDGVSLLNALHPIVGGQTFSNLLSTASALSQTSVEQLLIQIASAVDNNGKKIGLKSLKLVVSPSNILQAEVITKTVLRSGGQLNDLNPVKSMGLLPEPTSVISRMTSTTQWGILTETPGPGLQWIERWAMEKTMEGDFETDSMRYKATFRGREGWTDPRTLFGTSGL